MKKMISNTSASFAISALIASMAVVSSPAYANQQIRDMSVTQLSPSTTQLRLGFQGGAASPTAYKLTNPDRLVLDFNQVSNGLSSASKSFNVGIVNDVVTRNSGSLTRVIVGLKRQGEYTAAVEGNDLLLTLTDPNVPATANSVSPIGNATNNTTTVVVEEQPTEKDKMVVRVNPLLDPSNSQISHQYNYDGLSAINFAGNKNGGGTVSIDLRDDSIPVDVQRQGNKLVIRMTGSTIPRNLLRRYNTGSGLVASIDTKNQNKNGVVTINMSADYDYQAYQSGSQLNIIINKPKMLREPTIEEKTYSGKPLSMEFQDVEIRSVLDILAQFTDMNLVATDAVSGNITLRLINVPWDQALDIILKSKNLGKRQNGNVILIAPLPDLVRQEQEERKAIIEAQDIAPLRTEYIRLSYAKVADVLNLISQGRGSNSSNNLDRNSLLSNRGTVSVDERTNTLIVKDTSESIENIRALVKKIDIPVKQVMIEARIVNANDNFSKELGVKWGILSNGAATNRNLLVGGNLNTIDSLRDYSVQTTTLNGQTVTYPKYDIAGASNLNVDLGASSAAGRIAFGLLSMSNMMLDLELSAMQADNRGEVISSPKILTADKQTAKVSSGTQIPYQEAAASGATSVSFKEAALSLEVTPNITPDGKIGLDLNIRNGSPQTINGQTAIAEDSIETNVIVEDGQTVVLGGVFKSNSANSVNKVPFLGDLPFVGRAFRNDKRVTNKNELLIFITPKLINDGVSRID